MLLHNKNTKKEGNDWLKKLGNIILNDKTMKLRHITD